MVRGGVRVGIVVRVRRRVIRRRRAVEIARAHCAVRSAARTAIVAIEAPDAVDARAAAEREGERDDGERNRSKKESKHGNSYVGAAPPRDHKK
jgi:hypothetical protein